MRREHTVHWEAGTRVSCHSLLLASDHAERREDRLRPRASWIWGIPFPARRQELNTEEEGLETQNNLVRIFKCLVHVPLAIVRDFTGTYRSWHICTPWIQMTSGILALSKQRLWNGPWDCFYICKQTSRGKGSGIKPALGYTWWRQYFRRYFPL